MAYRFCILFWHLVAHHFFEKFVHPMQEAGESLFLLRAGPFPQWVILIKGEAAKVWERQITAVSSDI